MPEAETGTDAAQLFSALGDPTRLAIISRLGNGPASITGLGSEAAITRQALTKHLRVLEKAGLVQYRRQGRESLWSLQRQRLDEARAFLDLMSRQWDHRLDRLRAMVED